MAQNNMRKMYTEQQIIDLVKSSFITKYEINVNDGVVTSGASNYVASDTNNTNTICLVSIALSGIDWGKYPLEELKPVLCWVHTRLLTFPAYIDFDNDIVQIIGEYQQMGDIDWNGDKFTITLIQYK